MHQRDRVWLVVVGVLAAVAVAFFIYGRASPSESVPPYTTEQVLRASIRQVVNASGSLAPWSKVEVSSQISGQVSEVLADVGGVVKKGRVLARIDPATYRQKVREAQANLAAAEAQQAVAELDEQRMKGLVDKDLVTRQEYDQVAATLRQLQAATLTRKAALENARVDLERCTITSPIDGVVIYRRVDVGNTVVSSFSAPILFAIAEDLSKLRIVASINEADRGLVRPGLRVTFRVDALGEEEFEGKLIAIRAPYTPSDKQQQQQMQGQNSIPSFDGVIEVQNPEGKLELSLTAKVSVIIDEKKDVLAVPNAALRMKGACPLPSPPQRAKEGMETVCRVMDRSGGLEGVWIQTGISDGISTEVVHGLNSGDRVLTGTVELQVERDS